MNYTEEPISTNIGRYEAGDYFVTAASWERTLPYFGRCKSFEIGIRDLRADKADSNGFWLLQGEFNHQSVQEVAEAIAHLLTISSGENATLFFTPEWCLEHFK